MNLGYCQMGSPTLEVASLLGLASQFLPAPLPGKRLFCTSLVAGFEVVRMLLDVLNDVFLLHLALKPAQRAFDRLAFLHLDLSQTFPPPPLLGERCALRGVQRTLEQMLCCALLQILIMAGRGPGRLTPGQGGRE